MTELTTMIIHVLNITVIGMCVYDQYVLSGRISELEDELKRLKHRMNDFDWQVNTKKCSQ